MTYAQPCGQTLPDRRGRICAVCQRPIGLHHKFYFAGSSVQHRNCSNPEMYEAAEAPQPRLIDVAL